MLEFFDIDKEKPPSGVQLLVYGKGRFFVACKIIGYLHEYGFWWNAKGRHHLRPFDVEYWAYLPKLPIFLDRIFGMGDLVMKQNGLISVKDGLPDVGVDVLVYLKDKGFKSSEFYVTRLSKRGWDVTNVTHWMELPPKPLKDE